MARNAERNRIRQQRKADRLKDQASAVALVAIGLLLAPAFIGNPIFRSILAVVQPIAWLMLLGAGVFWAVSVGSKQANPAPPPNPANAWTPRPHSPPANPPTTRAGREQPSDTQAAKSFIANVVARQIPGDGVPARPYQWNALVFDVIEWRRFEALCERLFSQAGFETRSQSHGADEGIDIWLYSKTQPDAAVSVVQCKHWRSRSVKLAEVRGLLGSMAAKRVKRGVFATSSRFTADATQFGLENGIHLLDRTGLLGLIGKRTAEQQRELLMVATEGEFWIPTCASCGVKMVRRTPRQGGNAFWGCANYPRCKTVING